MKKNHCMYSKAQWVWQRKEAVNLKLEMTQTEMTHSEQQRRKNEQNIRNIWITSGLASWLSFHLRVYQTFLVLSMAIFIISQTSGILYVLRFWGLFKFYEGQCFDFCLFVCTLGVPKGNETVWCKKKLEEKNDWKMTESSPNFAKDKFINPTSPASPK